MKQSFKTIFLIILTMFLYSCSLKNSNFNNNEIVVNGKKFYFSDEYIEYKTKITDLYNSTFTDEEMKILNEAKHNQELINIRKQIMLSYSKQKHKHYLDKLKNILGEELYKKVTNQQFRSKQAQIFSQYNDRALKKMELEIAKEKKNSNEY